MPTWRDSNLDSIVGIGLSVGCQAAQNSTHGQYKGGAARSDALTPALINVEKSALSLKVGPRFTVFIVQSDFGNFKKI